MVMKMMTTIMILLVVKMMMMMVVIVFMVLLVMSVIYGGGDDGDHADGDVVLATMVAMDGLILIANVVLVSTEAMPMICGWS